MWAAWPCEETHQLCIPLGEIHLEDELTFQSRWVEATNKQKSIRQYYYNCIY